MSHTQQAISTLHQEHLNWKVAQQPHAPQVTTPLAAFPCALPASKLERNTCLINHISSTIADRCTTCVSEHHWLQARNPRKHVLALHGCISSSAKLSAHSVSPAAASMDRSAPQPPHQQTQRLEAQQACTFSTALPLRQCSSAALARASISPPRRDQMQQVYTSRASWAMAAGGMPNFADQDVTCSHSTGRRAL